MPADLGIELITEPQLIFLDEPTSGLDSSTAINVMDTVRKLAKDQGKTVIMTIHQPRTDILEMFDRIILLTMGRLAYCGATAGMP